MKVKSVMPRFFMAACHSALALTIFTNSSYSVCNTGACTPLTSFHDTTRDAPRSTTVSNVLSAGRSSTIANACLVIGEPGLKARTSDLPGSFRTIVENIAPAGNCGVARRTFAAVSISASLSGSSGCGCAGADA